MQALAVLLGLFLATFAGYALFNDNPLGGEPTARIVLRQQNQESPAAAPSVQGADTKTAARQPAAGAEQKTITIIDGSSGKRQDFVIGGDAAAKGDNDATPVPMAGAFCFADGTA